jgi:predicted DNA-binding transcriptional regulator AlpA
MQTPKPETHDENGNSSIGKYLNEHQVSEALGIPVGTLQRWRWQSRKRDEIAGPKFHKFGRLVRYRVADIQAYVESARQSGGSE